MGKLVLRLADGTTRAFALDRERVTIGRRADNDVCLPFPAVSGEHAAVVTILADSFLEDLNSTNGTLVNGQPVKKHFLKNGDVVELGKYKLKFIAEQAIPVADAADFEKTMVLRPNMVRPAPEAAAPAAPPAPAASSATAAAAPAGATPVAQAAAIQILNGANAGRELELTKTLTTLGKPGVQVAVIARRPHGYFITHVEGTQFPVVNGNTLDAQAHQLADHDVIEIAGIKMEFFLKT